MNALTLVEAGKIHRLIIETAPRHGKTELASVQFPLWAIGRNPSARFVLASYAASLSVLNSRKIRDGLQLPHYQKAFPHVHLRDDKASEKEWELTTGGSCMAVGVGSGLTGRGADYVIIDDPVKDREEARSIVTLENIWEWYTTVARTRLQPGGAIIFVMTRWSPQDLVGRVIQHAMQEESAFPVYRLRLPAIAEENDPLGRVPGEALWSDYPLEVLNDIRSLDPVNFDALYQQDPQGEGTVKFNRDDIAIASPNPRMWKVCRSWDLAVTDNEQSDYTVGALVYGHEVEVSAEVQAYLDEQELGTPHRIHVQDIKRQQAQFPEQRKMIIKAAREDGPDIPIVIEYTRMELAGIQILVEDLQGMGHQVELIKPKGDKIARKAQLEVVSAARFLTFAYGHWNEAAWLEFENFGAWDHDDIVDSIEQALTWFSQASFDWSFI